MIHIILADDHSIVRSGIKALINENFHGVKIEEAENGEKLLKLLKIRSFDLLLLDINMPDTDFVKLMEYIQATAPDTRVLVFTMHQEDIYGIRCLNLGARGFLHKTASNEEIIQAIKRVLDGKKYISPALAELLSDNNSQHEKTNPFQHLSARELELAMLFNKGKSLPEICSILNIQYSTANTHKRRLFEKLNVNNVLSLCRLMEAYHIQR
jgi:DNA-binding NarL/FixJ family response regulator